MRLVNAEAVLGRMNLTRSVGTNPETLVESVLDGVTPIIESIIRSSTQYAKRDDYFSHNRSKYADYKPLTLKLSQRFVIAKYVKVYISESGLPLGDLTDLTPLTSSDYLLDAEKGEITLLVEPPKGHRILAVRYRAGFDSESKEIPKWLQEAAISAAIAVHHAQAVTHGKKDVRDMSKELNRILYAQLSDYVYSSLQATFPEMTLTKT